MKFIAAHTRKKILLEARDISKNTAQTASVMP